MIEVGFDKCKELRSGSVAWWWMKEVDCVWK
jgi:hypothetical protein